MTAPIIAFFNNKGGVGKTSLVYHLAWKYADLGKRVIAADLDPQANLTAAFLEEDRLVELWPDGPHPKTIYGCIHPLVKGTGDIADAHVEHVAGSGGLFVLDQGVGLLIGDLNLSSFEDALSEVWPKCGDRDERAFRVTSAFWRIMQRAAQKQQVDVVLMDLGPNLGAINRAALIAANHIAIPLSPDLFSLQGLRNLGPTLRRWREEWKERAEKNPAADLALPGASMLPIGYIVLQHSERLNRPVKAYQRWIERIPTEYRTAVLADQQQSPPSVQVDPLCLALLKHYHSLVPMAQEARKPVFHLKPADGAIGAHYQSVRQADEAFEKLARRIAAEAGLALQ